MVKELERAETALIHKATDSGDAKKENNLPSTINRGAPGGWPTSSLYAAVIYSPQSHKLAVDSIVSKYTIVAVAKMPHPIIRFNLEKFIPVLILITLRK
jgi:hypothetical protein